MKTTLKIDLSLGLLILIILLSGAGGFGGGLAVKPRNVVHNSTNVVVNNNYAVSLSSSASASVAVGYAQTNVNVILNFELTNLIFELSNSITN